VSEDRPQPRRPIVRAGGRVAIVVSQSLPAGVDWAWHDDPAGGWFFVREDAADALAAALPDTPGEGRGVALGRVKAALAGTERRPPGPPHPPGPPPDRPHGPGKP
jgi:hypothetical protein